MRAVHQNMETDAKCKAVEREAPYPKLGHQRLFIPGISSILAEQNQLTARHMARVARP